MALDPELRAFLEAMEQRGDAKMAAMEQRLRTDIAAALYVAVQARDDAAANEGIEVARQEAREGFESANREAGALNDKALAAIKALGDGLAMHREASERRAEDRERALMNAHVLPPQSSATSQEGHPGHGEAVGRRPPHKVLVRTMAHSDTSTPHAADSQATSASPVP